MGWVLEKSRGRGSEGGIWSIERLKELSLVEMGSFSPEVVNFFAFKGHIRDKLGISWPVYLR